MIEEIKEGRKFSSSRAGLIISRVVQGIGKVIWGGRTESAHTKTRKKKNTGVSSHIQTEKD